MVKKRGILLRIITGTVMLILVVVSALVQTEPAAAAGSGISKVSFDGYLKGVETKCIPWRKTAVCCSIIRTGAHMCSR